MSVELGNRLCVTIFGFMALYLTYKAPFCVLITMYPIFYIDQSNAKEKPKRKLGVIESCPLWELSCVEVIEVEVVEVIEEEVVLKR